MVKWIGFQKGINLGGWLAQSSLKKEHLDSFITRDDMQKISSMGFDHVRLPIDYTLIQSESGEIIESGFEYIDRCVSWCDEFNLNLILDLHKIQGYNFLDGETDGGFFHNEKVIVRFLDIWIAFSKKYGSRPERIAFELINAVMNETDQTAWLNIAKSAVSIMRVFAPNTKILIPGGGHSSVNAILRMSVFHDPNIGFSFHCYEPVMFCQQKAYWRKDIPQDLKVNYPISSSAYYELLNKNPQLMQFNNNTCPDLLGPDYFKNLFQNAVSFAEKMNTFIYCVEYGVIDRADNTSTIHWFKQIHEAFELYGIGRAMWTYKELDYGLMDQRFEGLREIIQQYL